MRSRASSFGLSAMVVTGVAIMASCVQILGDVPVKGTGETGGASGTGGGTTSSSGSTGGGTTSSTTSSSTSASSTTGSSSSGACAMSGTITGKSLINQVDLTQVVASKPVDFTNVANLPQARVFDTAQNQFSSLYAASGDAKGNFTIGGVPDGPYFLDFGSYGFWMGCRDLDLSSYQTFVLDYTPLTMTPQVHLVANNMTAWQAGDVIELIDPASSAYAYDDQSAGYLTPAWADGATHIDATGDWISWVYGITVPVQASSTVSMFHAGVLPGQTYKTVVDYATVNFSTPDVNSPPFDITANFTPFSHTSSVFHLNVDVPKFLAAAATSNPRATAFDMGVDYQVHPGPLEHGQLMGTADLAFERFTAPSAAQDKMYVFGNPFKNWTMFVSFDAEYTLSFQLPGTNPQTIQGFWRGFPLRCDLLTNDILLNPNSAFAPPDTPAQNLQIDGKSLWDPSGLVTAGSITPTISWTPSATTHQFWSIGIIPVTNKNGNTLVHPGLSTVINAAGDTTSVRVPPGYMQPASHYLITVRGVSHTSVDYQKTPGGGATPFCATTAISDIVSTP